MSKKIQIILKQNYNNIGEKNNIVYVAKGYAINYLIPNKIANIATKKTIQHYKMLDLTKKQKIENHKIKIEKLKKELDLINKIVFYKKIGDKQYIFGSLTEKDIIQKINEYTGIKLEKKHIQIPNIKKLGTFHIEINLQYKKFCKIKIHILPTNI